MADISRNSFNESKYYDKVILQQGSPITDYDFNEAQDIQRVKLRKVLKELFGDGAIGDGFKVNASATPNGNVIVKAGTIYLSGYRAVIGSDITLSLPGAPTSGTRVDYVYAEVTESEIDSTQDPDIVHPKLTVEPTRRIKITVTIKTGTSVPTDTDTIKRYSLAEIFRNTNDNTIAQSDITDRRSVKVTFEGAGFSVKGSATLGDAEDDVISVVGRLTNGSNTFGGYLYIDDNTQITGQLKVSSDIIATGKVVQTGKYYEVARLPLYGAAGDLQYQSDAVAWEDVTELLYNLFNTSYAIPSVPTGATRKYKLLISYSDNALGAGATGQIRLVDNATTPNVITTFVLPLIVGSTDGSRRFVMSSEFTTASTAHMKLQAQIQNGAGTYAGGGFLAIYHVDLIAYDVY